MIKNCVLYGLTGLLCSVLLTGCGSTLSDSAAEINTVNYPIVVEYDAQTQDKAAVELESGACPVLSEMVVDYGQMRDETRVLLGEKVDVSR